MDNSQQTTEKIIQYLDGELTGKELDEFEKLMGENAGIREELGNFRLAKSAIRHYGLKEQVAGVHKEMMDEFSISVQNAPVRKMYPFIRRTMQIAASLIAILFVFGFYQYITVNSDQLATESYHPYKVSISRGESKTSSLEKAYLDGKNNLVIAEFEKLKPQGNKDNFLAAQAYLSTHQTVKAIQTFNNLLRPKSSDTSFHDDAEYYLAIGYLENNEPSKAKSLLDKIYRDNDHLYHDQVSYWILLKLKLLSLKTGN
jgi:hypothetical protein